MDFNGLSVDQAPPISAPLRFFLSAPIFGILAGFLLLFTDASLLMSRFSQESIVITHAITIGFIGFVMLGALTQMLPVLAGAKIPKVLTITTFSHLFLVVGIISMIIGLLNNEKSFNTIAIIGLGSGFLLMLIAISLSIIKVKNFTETVIGMSISLFFAFFTVLMGLYLLLSYTSGNVSEIHLLVSNIHSVWGIFGFAGILIIGVSFQVLPMFYVAPHFKEFCKKRVTSIITFSLIGWLILNLYFSSYTIVAKVFISAFFLAFSIAVWKKLNNRRRSVSDITIWYWRTSSIFLALGSLSWIANEYFDNEYIVIVSIFIGAGFILSVMIGMLYKIIPFLVWFHLNGSGYMSIPTMNEMINKNLAKLQFILFLVSILGFIFSFFFAMYLKIFAVTFILSMLILQFNVIMPVLIYIKTKKTKPDFDMSAFATN